MPPEKHETGVLFRFRNLVASTLEEHRKIIALHGSCWWGWWKRPHEDSHEQVWRELGRQAREPEGAWVWLFDSGCLNDERAVWRARVVDVEPPLPSGDRPPLREEDQKLVPEYYRLSPFSRAWLRLQEIENSPQPEFFGRYSFAAPPPLRGLEQHQLDRLSNKRIIDSDELKLMDTTIWRIRASREEDGADRFLAPVLRVSRPVSSEPIAVRGSAILHLTDMHFATGSHTSQHRWKTGGPESLATRVAICLERHKTVGQVGIVIVTGDSIFDPRCGDEEFEQAAGALNALLGSLGLDSESLVIVPGNHDIAWTKAEGKAYTSDCSVENPPEDATRSYAAFYRKLHRHDPHPNLAMGRRYVLPAGTVIEVCALNSSNLETGKTFLAGMGRIGASVFQDVRSELGWDENAGSMALRILALHHHLTATEDVERAEEYYTGFGLAIDAKSILRDAARCGVHLVLHGHRHREFFWREEVYALPEDTHPKWHLGSVSILGGGSAGSTDLPGAKSNFFRLIDVQPSQLAVHIFRAKKDSPFELMKRWTAPFGFSNGRLILDSWEPQVD